MQKSSLGNPAPIFDQFLMHDGNLSGWTTKTDETQLEPEGKSLPKTNGGMGSRCLGHPATDIIHAHIPLAKIG
ncbi:MAG TPA: hypothetical protein PK261_04835, partial [Accumulibacter sp.]|nr:hypothetical protein [Accumulibacter sp.]